MHNGRYTNKKGQEKITVSLSLEEARRAVQSPAELVAALRDELGDAAPREGALPPKVEGDGLDMLFGEMGRRIDPPEDDERS